MTAMRNQSEGVSALGIGRCFLCWLIFSCLATSSPSFASMGAKSPDFCRGSSVENLERSTGREIKPSPTGRARWIVFAISDREPIADGVVHARLVNLGYKFVLYGAAFSIERFDGRGWSVDPHSPTGPWPQVRYRLDPQSAGRCMRFGLNSDMTSGRYRLVTTVMFDSRSIRRYAEFRIENS
jgi:hypothetical protein